MPPAVAVHLLGPGGAFLITLQLFMAVTSTGAAEQIAVATLFSYDVWKRYIQPDVDGRRIVLISRQCPLTLTLTPTLTLTLSLFVQPENCRQIRQLFTNYVTLTTISLPLP